MELLFVSYLWVEHAVLGRSDVCFEVFFGAGRDLRVERVWLSDAFFFQPAVVHFGEAVVLSQGFGEVVVAGVFGFGAHINVVVSTVAQNGLDRALFRDAYGSGWEAKILVCVVRRVDLKVLEKDPSQTGFLEGKLYGGIGLKLDATAQSIQV